MRWNWTSNLFFQSKKKKKKQLPEGKSHGLHVATDRWTVAITLAATAASGASQRGAVREAETGSRAWRRESTCSADGRPTVCLSNGLCNQFLLCWRMLLNVFVAKFDLF